MNMRGRPALKTYLLARQGELFLSADHTAYLEKRYPYLAAMRALVDASFSSRTAGRAADGGRDEKASKPSKISPVSASFFCQAGEVAPPASSSAPG